MYLIPHSMYKMSVQNSNKVAFVAIKLEILKHRSSGDLIKQIYNTVDNVNR